MHVDRKDSIIRGIIQDILTDERSLESHLDNLKHKEDKIRSPSFEALKRIADMQPDLLYNHWDYFVNLLEDKNNYRKFIAVHILARLVCADKDKKFEQIFDFFYNHLGASVIVAGHITELSARIVAAKPELEPVITSRLLNIDKTTQKHKDLIKSGAISSFIEYYDMARDKEGIIQFVRNQLKSTSPKTRKLAKEFFEILEEK